MKAAAYRRTGPPEVIEVIEKDKPIAKDNEVLVRVYASSVNPVDTMLRRSKAFSFFARTGDNIVGSDLSGIIESAGRNVTTLKKGDEIYGFRRAGATAEYSTIQVKKVAIKPKNMTFEQAAAVPLAGLTALQALHNIGKIQSGQNVLINGATGGVGSYAVQIAKSYDTNVTGVTSESNLKLAESLGADNVINYNKENFTNSKDKFDIILDAAAKSNFSKCQNILNNNGIFISTRFGARLLLNILLTSIVGNKKAKTVMVNSNTKDLDTLTNLIENDKIISVIEKTFPIDKTSDAHAHIEKGHTKGKIVINI
ncbi:NAD(P)-dependent alcohol dehydrogenase [Thermoproteota archaeon]